MIDELNELMLVEYGKAKRAKERLSRVQTEEMKQQIIDTAECSGLLSIWVDVFSEDDEMVSRFIKSFEDLEYIPKDE